MRSSPTPLENVYVHESIDCGVWAGLWKACMKTCVFTSDFYTSHACPPGSAPLCFLQLSSCMGPVSSPGIYIHASFPTNEIFTKRSFSLRSLFLLFLYTWTYVHDVSFFPPPIHVFYMIVFLQGAFLLRPPHQLVVFFTLGLFTQYNLFLPPIHAFLYESFFTECIFSPAPPPTGSFFTRGFFTQCTFFLPPPHAVFFTRQFFTHCVFSSGPPTNR